MSDEKKPALPEPVAFDVSNWGSLYSEAQLQEALARAVECEGNLNNLLTALNFHTGENHGIMAIRKLVDRATTAEAALATARKVIEPFAEASRKFDEAAVHFEIEPRGDDYKPRTEFTHGQLRAARQWLDANRKEKGNENG